MLDINKAINTILINDSAVSAIVGDKVFPVVAPDKDSSGNAIDYPLVILNREEAIIDYAGGKCSTSEVIVSATCYSTSYAQVIDLLMAVKEALDGYKGTVEGIRIRDIRVSNVPLELFGDNAYAEQILFAVR